MLYKEAIGIWLVQKNRISWNINSKNMNNLSWYFNLYYKFRDYPISQLNSTLKQNQLKVLYSNMLRKTFMLFQLDNRKDGEIEGLISKNNYDLMLNKKNENNLAQEEIIGNSGSSSSNVGGTPPQGTTTFQITQSHTIISPQQRSQTKFRDSVSSFHPQHQRCSSSMSRDSRLRWIVEHGPNQRNMDVFYELMIKMIRVSFRRLMIQTFALDRYGMNISKEAIKQILQISCQFQGLRQFGQRGDRTSQQRKQIIQIVHYPPTIQQMKFQFLKYSISSKVYNNPQNLRNSLQSQSSLTSGSQIQLISHKTITKSSDSHESDHVVVENNLGEEKQVKKDKQRQGYSVNDNQIEGLILKVSEGETSIFNIIIEMYQKQVKSYDKNKTEILGVKHIAQSILDFASQQYIGKSMPLIFEDAQTSIKKSSFEQNGNRRETDGSLSNSNILLATWFDLILFKETPMTLLSIIEELVKIQSKHSSQKTGLTTQYSKAPTSSTTRPSNPAFYAKINSYLHLLILNSTKNIFIQSLLKINYLLVMSKDVIGGENGSKRSFKEIFCKDYEEKEGEESKVYNNVPLTYDARNKKYLWKEEAQSILISKWKIIANVITELCAKDTQAFFVAIFQKCVALLDKQLSIQVQLIQKLMSVVQNIQDSIAPNPGSTQYQKAKHTCRVLSGIIREIIGFGEKFEESTEERSQEKYLNINNIINMKTQIDRYKETTFANREECAQEIQKWNQIISQNIYVYSQYKNNLELISKLFKNNHLYVALWFNKFHAETKTLVKKVSKDRLQKIFDKFTSQIPSLWDSMTTDNQIKKNQKSRFKRTERGKVRNRISSIKVDKPLSVLEKKTIVLNYIMKAQLELYSHYMLINYLNSQKNFSQLFEKEGERPIIRSKPQLFSHHIIKKIILFSSSDQKLKTIKLQKQTYANISRRTHKHVTSSFGDSLNSSFSPDGLKSMKNIQKSANCDIQDLLNAINHFEKPMDLQLELDYNWKERIGQQEVQYLGQLNDYIRYLNQINYLYQFWSWQQSPFKPQRKRKPIELLDGSQYNLDLQEINAAFSQIIANQNLIQEMSIFKGDPHKVIHKEQLTQMLKRIKIHNKELYMIIQAIVQGENYFKLIGNNLIGREKNGKFKQILEDIMGYYKNNKRQKPSVRILDKLRENLQFEGQIVKKESTTSLKKQVQSVGSVQEPYSMPDLLINRKSSKKGKSVVSQFEFAPEYYKIQSKIFRLNCLRAALEIDNSIFRNVKHSHVLSKQKLQKLKIIGGPYYDKLQNLLIADKIYDNNELMIGQETLHRVKNVYEKKLLLLIITIINMNYTVEDKVKRFTGRGRKQINRVEFSNIPEEDLRSYTKVLEKYTELLKKFMYWRIKENIKRVEEREKFEQMNTEHEKKDQKDFSVCTFLEEVLQLSEKNQEMEEDLLMIRLQMEIQKQSNLKFSQEFRKSIQEQTINVQIYKTEEEKVQYLRKKLSYLLMRQMYFTLNYENEFLAKKSVNSKKNYTIYEERIYKFFEQIIRLDYQQFCEKKQEQIKKRSIHLKNYQLKYEKKPQIAELQTKMNQLLCCLFNQLLMTYTTKVQQRMLTYKTKPIAQASYSSSNIYQSYCASAYSKEVPKENPKKPFKKKRMPAKMHKSSISSIFANIFSSKNGQNDNQLTPLQALLNAGQNHKNSSVFTTVLVYTLDKFDLSQALKIYFKIIAENDYSYSKPVSEHNRKRYNYSPHNSRVQEPITEQQLQLIKNNESSLISLLKSQFLQNINLMKCKLIRKNLISNVQRLYINLDVRHKVFQSFKDRILNYQLQKSNIYHQYMDYIRGLKLDVYSHMAGEQSLPYIKIIHAVKLYRIRIKKQELEQRVNQEFQKNLGKWNKGIQDNLQKYNMWLMEQEKMWSNKEVHYKQQIKNLQDIHNIVMKQAHRQNKMIKKKIVANSNASSQKTIIEHGEGEENRQKMFQLSIMTPFQNEGILKKSVYLKQKQIKISQASKTGVTTPTINFTTKTAKNSMTQTTKQNTKYQKLTLSSQPRGLGLRGISMKYDISNYLPPSHEDIRNKQRNTEAFSRTGLKTASSTVYKKQMKRYQSAQKMRNKECYQ